MSCLCNIAAMWTFVTIARRAIDATLFYYYAQVSEFAKELLVAQEHYKHNPNFWINSGLIEHQEMKKAIFEVARVTSSNFNGLSTSETTQ